MILRLLALALILIGTKAHADDLTATRIISGDEIALSDGQTLRLSGIQSMAGAQAFLESSVAGKKIELQNPVTDRYGRIDAVVLIQNQDLQKDLLKQGLAFVYPAEGDELRLDDMLKIEREARIAKRGAWADNPDTSSDDAEKLYGHYGFVRGTITKAERVKNKLYLNFGADWRTDFTIAIAAHDLRAFKKADLDPLTWQGKTVRVRGWIKRDFGPMITVTDPHQIELLN